MDGITVVDPANVDFFLNERFKASLAVNSMSGTDDLTTRNFRDN